jgi:N-acetylglutamate synthase-like GNAT family acetyltransferase
MRAQTRELVHLFVPVEKRGEGQASTLMHQVCNEADQHGITIVLFANPYGDADLGRSQLIKWYAKEFGFIPIQADPPLMARMPGSTPRMLSPVARAASEVMQ